MTPNIHAGRRQCASWCQPGPGITEADCVENIRRVAEIAKLMVDAGLIVIVSLISPFRAEPEFARSLFEPGEFYEIFVDTPFAVRTARRQVIICKGPTDEAQKFTGIDSLYERQTLRISAWILFHDSGRLRGVRFGIAEAIRRLRPIRLGSSA